LYGTSDGTDVFFSPYLLILKSSFISHNFWVSVGADYLENTFVFLQILTKGYYLTTLNCFRMVASEFFWLLTI
jgi:hypothetical protein